MRYFLLYYQYGQSLYLACLALSFFGSMKIDGRPNMVLFLFFSLLLFHWMWYCAVAIRRQQQQFNIDVVGFFKQYQIGKYSWRKNKLYTILEKVITESISTEEKQFAAYLKERLRQ